MTESAVSAHGPWVDVHAHPGCGFLGGLPPENAMIRNLGAAMSDGRVSTAATGDVATVNVSTVADFAVLGLGDKGLSAVRAFEPGEAAADHRRQIEAVSAVFDRDDVTAVLSASDIVAAQQSGRTGVFLGCEGADFLAGDGTELQQAYSDGVRAITLVHYRVNELGDIQTEDHVHHGLTTFGREVVQEMNRLGIIVDLAHATMQVTADALDESSAPIMISHSHLASVGSAHPRLLTEEHAAMIAEAGGVIGAWPAGISSTTLGDYVEEICRLIDVVGVDHVAIGTDLDANYRPVLTSYDQFPEVARMLGQRGLHRDEVDQVLGGNFIRVFEAVERAATS